MANRKNSGRSPMPLEGIRVLDVGNFTSAACCSLFLADFGAEVIKVERPPLGDGNRHVGPFVQGRNGQKIGYHYIRHGRNKKVIALDLATEEGRATLKKLVKVSDVLIENFRAGTLEKLGLGYETLKAINPRLIYASVSGYGHYDCYDDNYRTRGMYDPIAQAVGGVMDSTGPVGGPPSFVGGSIGDMAPAILAAYGILLAILHRQKTGVGQHVDIAMYDTAVLLNDKPLAAYMLTGYVQERGRIVEAAPYGAFQAEDGYIVIAITKEEQWLRFCKAMEREDLIGDPRLSSHADRFRNLDNLLKPIIEDWLKDKTRAEAQAILDQYEVAAGPVQTVKDLADDPQLRSRGMYVEFDDPVFGRLRTLANPVKLSNVPPIVPDHIPLVGEATEEVLSSVLETETQRG